MHALKKLRKMETSLCLMVLFLKFKIIIATYWKISIGNLREFDDNESLKIEVQNQNIKLQLKDFFFDITNFVESEKLNNF